MALKEILGFVVMCVMLGTLLILAFVLVIIGTKEETERKRLLNKKTNLEIKLLEDQLKDVNDE